MVWGLFSCCSIVWLIQFLKNSLISRNILGKPGYIQKHISLLLIYHTRCLFDSKRRFGLLSFCSSCVFVVYFFPLTELRKCWNRVYGHTKHEWHRPSTFLKWRRPATNNRTLWQLLLVWIFIKQTGTVSLYPLLHSFTSGKPFSKFCFGSPSIVKRAKVQMWALALERVEQNCSGHASPCAVKSYVMEAALDSLCLYMTWTALIERSM